MAFVTKHKYNAKATIVDDIRFPSKMEAKYYSILKRKQELGEVVFFLMQVPFRLIGGVKYVCDFQVFLSDGTVEFIEIKGKDTPISILKRKQVMSMFPIEIKVITKL